MRFNPIIVKNISGTNTYASAKLMKTGQTTSYRTGDDGDIEAGREDSFFVLKSNNPFGNTNRFTDELGGQTYTNNIVIDWSTFDGVSVLGYYRRLMVSGGVYDFTWNNAIDLCLAFSIGSYTSGWRMPNENELHNICNFSVNTCFSYYPFVNPYGSLPCQNLWTSTTLTLSTANALFMPNYNYGYFSYAAKTTSFRTIAVRNFTVTGTTLT